MTLPILFDLDGTLVESGPSITTSIRATMKEIDGPELDDATLRAFIGPPLRNGFEDLAGLHGDQLERAVAFYMNHQLTEGINIIEPYEGIPELLQELRSADIPLAVATSKRTLNARKVLDNTDLAQYFVGISGSEPERMTKRHSIETALYLLEQDGHATKNAVMVGDRIHDIEGARHFHMPVIAVTWGYGTHDEYAHADAVVDTVAELGEKLQKGL